MSMDTDMRERHGRVLGELAEVGMAMVRRLSAAMLAAEDVQTQAQVGLAFHRVSRAVRQTMALEFRLAQEARREDRGAPAAARSSQAAAAPPPPPARPAVERVSWNEYERCDADEDRDALDDLLDAEELDVEAVHEAVEASMQRLRRDIAADPLLVKAGVLEASAPLRVTPKTPPARNRRSELLGGGAVARPVPSISPIPSVATTRPALRRSSA